MTNVEEYRLALRALSDDMASDLGIPGALLDAIAEESAARERRWRESERRIMVRYSKYDHAYRSAWTAISVELQRLQSSQSRTTRLESSRLRRQQHLQRVRERRQRRRRG